MGLRGTGTENKRTGTKGNNGKIIALSLFVILLIFIGYSANKKEIETEPVGKPLSYSEYTGKCENSTYTVYVCQNGAIADKAENCLSANTTVETILGASQPKNTFSVRRCLSGRCIEAEISRDFDFLEDECSMDEECYNIACYRKTTTGTTTTRTTTTSMTTTTIQDDCTILDCPAGTKYVGSKFTMKYYRCSSECGARILDKYRVCLKTDEEALAYGFEVCHL